MRVCNVNHFSTTSNHVIFDRCLLTTMLTAINVVKIINNNKHIVIAV